MSNLQSIFFYFLCFCLSTFLVYKGNKKDAVKFNAYIFSRKISINPFVIAGILAPITLGFLRYGIGTDYAAYLEIYQYNAFGKVINNNANYASSIEPIFRWLAVFSYKITKTPLLFFGIPWSVTVLLSYFGIQNLSAKLNEKSLSLIWFTLISIIVPFGFNQIRQALAASIFLFSIKYLLENNKKINLKYAMATVLAFLCHYSSIFIMVPIFFVSRFIIKSNKIKKINFYILVFGLISILLLIFTLLIFKDFISTNFYNIKYVREFYRLLFITNNLGFIDIRPDNLIVFTVFAFPLIATINFKKKLTDSQKLLLSFCYIGLSLTFLSFFLMNGERFAQYFMLFAPIAYFNITSEKQRFKAMTLYPLATFFLIMFLGWQSVTHYNTFLNSNIDINTIHQRRVRALYSQIQCVLNIKECDNLWYYDGDINNRVVYTYVKGDLWGLE